MFQRTNRLSISLKGRLLSSKAERNCLISTSNWTDSKYFTQALHCDANETIYSKDNIFEAATIDFKVGKMKYSSFDEYMRIVSRNAVNFQKSGNLIESIDLSKLLQSKVSSNAPLTFVFGQPQSKSCLLLDNAGNEFGAIFQVDALDFGASALDSGLVTAVKHANQQANRNKSLLDVIGKNVASSLSFAADSFSQKVKGFDIASLTLSNGLSTVHSSSNASELVSLLLKRHDKITIRVDNAEALFPALAAVSSSSSSTHTTNTLQLLHSLTAKHHGKVRVVLTSQDAYLSAKLAPHMRLITGLAPKVVLLGEMSPADTITKLQRDFGVGEHLAVSLVNVFGGQLGDCLAALECLALDRERFAVSDVLDTSAVEHAIYSSLVAAEDKAKMRDALQQLATTGFVPVVSPNDPVARVIAEHQLGVVVSVRDTVPSLDPSLWGSSGVNPNEFKFALLPHKQSHRLVVLDTITRFSSHSNLLSSSHSKSNYSSSSISEATDSAAAKQISANNVQVAQTIAENKTSSVGSVTITAVPVETPVVPAAAPVVVEAAVLTTTTGTPKVNTTTAVDEGVALDGYDEKVTRADLKHWATTGELSSLTLAQLRVVCTYLGVGQGGAKAAVVKRIGEKLQQQ